MTVICGLLGLSMGLLGLSFMVKGIRLPSGILSYCVHICITCVYTYKDQNHGDHRASEDCNYIPPQRPLNADNDELPMG